ncbi:MAG: D-alanyl-D-alanine carboxypeptidase [Eubacterium sp.]|nr:D-alanyl-D-alanine carboxypeptidase [Eubacterium sp.]
MKKVVVFVLMILLLSSIRLFSARGDELKLGCVSGVLIDGNTGRILYEKNAFEKRAMASTTKIMTCILALENGNPDDVVTVSQNAVGQPRVRMDVRLKEQYYLKDLLHALMLESYNDVAVVIAEHIGGSVKGFSKMMNRKARELGMTHSHFVTPNGLDAPKHYSNAYEMALLGAYAMKNQEFVKIVNRKKYSFSEITRKRNIVVTNHDLYLQMDSGAIGIKTGFTNQAGYCFVGANQSEQKIFVSCVLGSGWPPSKNQKWKDTMSLMGYGKKKYQWKKISPTRQFTIQLRNGTFRKMFVRQSGTIKILKNKKEKIRYENIYSYNLPVRKNQVVGYTKVYINDFYFGKIPIKSMENIPIYNYGFCFGKIMDLFYI